MKRRRNPARFIVIGLMSILFGVVFLYFLYSNNKTSSDLYYYDASLAKTNRLVNYTFFGFGVVFALLGLFLIFKGIINIHTNRKRMNEIKDFFYTNYNRKLIKFVEGNKSWNYGAIGIDTVDGLIVADTNVIKIEDVTNIEMVKDYIQSGSVSVNTNGNQNSVSMGSYSGTSYENASGIRIYTKNIQKPIVFVSGDNEFSYEAYSTILAVINNKG